MDDINSPPDDFIPIERVCAMTHYSRAGIYRAVTGKRFPAPVKFGPGKSLWIGSEVRAWIAARIAERDGAAA